MAARLNSLAWNLKLRLDRVLPEGHPKNECVNGISA